MIEIDWTPFRSKVISYYHSDVIKSHNLTFYGWLTDEFNCVNVDKTLRLNRIKFETESDLTYFILRWA